jgi:hypothetical protein
LALIVSDSHSLRSCAIFVSIEVPMKRSIAFIIFLAAAAAVFAQDLSLPAPAKKSGVDLFAAIANRSVSKTFVKKDVSPQDLSTILWAGIGLRPVDAVTSATKAGRTVSFSGDNPYINVYVLTDGGAWKYSPESNKLEARSAKDVRSEVSSGVVPTAAFMVVFTVDTALTPSFLKSNPVLFLQMAHATAGFAAQNIALSASTLKLATVIKYTMSAPGATGALKLAKEEVPLFTLQAGYTD